MTLTKLIVAAAALSFVAIGAADAAGKPKPHKIVPLSKACGGWIDWYESAEAP